MSEYKEQFVKLTSQLWTWPEITKNNRLLVMASIISFTHKDRPTAWAATETLCQMAGCNRNTVSRAVAWLEAEGLVSVVRRKKKPNVYTVNHAKINTNQKKFCEVFKYQNRASNKNDVSKSSIIPENDVSKSSIKSGNEVSESSTNYINSKLKLDQMALTSGSSGSRAACGETATDEQANKLPPLLLEKEVEVIKSNILEMEQVSIRMSETNSDTKQKTIEHNASNEKGSISGYDASQNLQISNAIADKLKNIQTATLNSSPALAALATGFASVKASSVDTILEATSYIQREFKATYHSKCPSKVTRFVAMAVKGSSYSEWKDFIKQYDLEEDELAPILVSGCNDLENFKAAWEQYKVKAAFKRYTTFSPSLFVSFLLESFYECDFEETASPFMATIKGQYSMGGVWDIMEGNVDWALPLSQMKADELAARIDEAVTWYVDQVKARDYETEEEKLRELWTRLYRPSSRFDRKELGFQKYVEIKYPEICGYKALETQSV